MTFFSNHFLTLAMMETQIGLNMISMSNGNTYQAASQYHYRIRFNISQMVDHGRISVLEQLDQ